jgi:predicted enzyme related to lactoylglutathione lyase
MNVWYRVSDLDAACRFYVKRLGFVERYRDDEDRWARLELNGVELSLTEDPDADTGEGVMFTADVPNLKDEAERLRAAGVDVSTVIEIPGSMRLVDIQDPDGNRIQLTEEV